MNGFLQQAPAEVAFELADGRTLGRHVEAPAATIVFRTEAIAASLVAAPSLVAFGEAFAAGDIDVRGDLVVALAAAYALDAAAATRWHAPARRPDLEDAVRFHYDLSDAFFALFLDRRMVYTCAYYRHDDADLDEAQAAKLELVCRKLRLRADDRVLDVGCGWGGLAIWAAARYGADVTGVTLSPAQAAYAATAAAQAGVAPRTRIEHRDYRTLEGEARFDKIAALGVLEHLGLASWDEYFDRLHRLLRPGGLLLNHGITHVAPGSYSSGMAFLTRHVFPGADFERIGHVVSRMEAAGFRIVDVEALGGHYARTTRDWLARLQARAADARALVGERTYRTWIAYLAAATAAFRAGWIDVHQVLARRPDPAVAIRAETREALYRD